MDSIEPKKTTAKLFGRTQIIGDDYVAQVLFMNSPKGDSPILQKKCKTSEEAYLWRKALIALVSEGEALFLTWE